MGQVSLTKQRNRFEIKKKVKQTDSSSFACVA
jgi:hypothetical protein